MRPLAPQLCTGQVFHRRHVPTTHEFAYPISYLFFDPDHPAEVTSRHPLWSTGRWSPVQIRSEDYGGDDSAAGVSTLGDEVRSQLADLPDRPFPNLKPGPVRLLTQPRRWGWLFNPISVFVAWSDPGTDPAMGSDEVETEQHPLGVVLEVTNTPWKERHRYPMMLERTSTGGSGRQQFAAEFDKVLHVSPFLHEDYRYRLTIEWGTAQTEQAGSHRLGIGVDVLTDNEQLVIETKMDLAVEPADRSTLGRSVRRDGFPTHRTSYGIHRQAASLAKKRVPFVAHPKSRTPQPASVRDVAVKGGSDD